MLAKNKSGWMVLEYLNIKEEEVCNYPNVTGAFAIVNVKGKYLIGFNNWRKQWEFPAGGIDKGETPRCAAARALFDDTHQKASDLQFRGLFKVMKPDGEIKYQAIFLCFLDELVPFTKHEREELDEIMLWDLK